MHTSITVRTEPLMYLEANLIEIEAASHGVRRLIEDAMGEQTCPAGVRAALLLVEHLQKSVSQAQTHMEGLTK